eukprot:10030688-Karenia_brevis.AAC.1
MFSPRPMGINGRRALHQSVGNQNVETSEIKHIRSYRPNPWKRDIRGKPARTTQSNLDEKGPA